MTRTIATLAMALTLGLAGCAGQRTVYPGFAVMGHA